MHYAVKVLIGFMLGVALTVGAAGWALNKQLEQHPDYYVEKHAPPASEPDYGPVEGCYCQCPDPAPEDEP